MVQINFAQKQVNAKIVYYGPGMSGKTTNLEVIHQRAPEGNRGELTSISTDGDRTLFFDFMPLDLGTVAGMRTCFQVYTVPGQVYYNSTRKLVLQGVDGVIFIADSSPDMMEENLESMRNLHENLSEYGRSAEEIPLVIQYNKRDMPGALPIEELEAQLNTRGVPAFEGIANTGQGVFPTLKAVAACVLDSLHKQSGASGSQSDSATAPATAQPAPDSATPNAAVGATQPHAPQATPASNAQTPAAPPQTTTQPEMQSTPAVAQADDRQTMSMSQTGFHKAPSLPLHGAAATESAQPPAAPVSGGLQMRASESEPASGLQMSAPAQPAQAADSAQPTLSMAPPAAAPQAAQQPTAVATAPAAPQANPVEAQTTMSSVMAVEQNAVAAPRRSPTSKSFPSRAQAPQATPQGAGKKSAALTAVIVIASVGLGAALGSFVLSIL